MDFNELNFNELDKDLSDAEQQEWNNIYASFRSGSLLRSKVVGFDTIKVGDNSVNCLIVIAYRVKVLIPEREVWYDKDTIRPSFVLMSMVGAQIDYVITNIDREGGCAVASRRKALEYRRRKFKKERHKIGDKIDAHILAVGRGPVMVEAGGWDITLSQRDVSYCMVPDMREVYHPGQTCKAVIKSIDEAKELIISIKETEPHPFDGADQRHPVGCRRASKITGKYGGGVFCRLDNTIDCLCLSIPTRQ